ncbi:2'-5' RNA ligase family protein [Sphingomonas sp. LT1P40]|uniref:2'-5' RNA ligase family protein n=1 Tax=Alteristakelama amylovorans TaxID=3096166 RepID=UPI002FC5BF8F
MAGQVTRRAERPLYMMFKPPPRERARLIRLCAALGIEIGYAPERWHGTLLPIGETASAAIDAVHRALETFDAAPFSVAFDHIEGDTLKPRKGQRTPGYFQRALAARIARCGVMLPDYAFSLHLNLAYGGASLRCARLPPIEWPVEEILLIESGSGRHIEHGRWPLIDRQGMFAF